MKGLSSPFDTRKGDDFSQFPGLSLDVRGIDLIGKREVKAYGRCFLKVGGFANPLGDFSAIFLPLGGRHTLHAQSYKTTKPPFLFPDVFYVLSQTSRLHIKGAARWT